MSEECNITKQIPVGVPNNKSYIRFLKVVFLNDYPIKGTIVQATG